MVQLLRGAQGYIDLIENADNDAPPVGVTRIIRKGGNLYQRIDGAAATQIGGGGGQDPAAVAITGGSIVGVSLYGSSAQSWTNDKAFMDDYDAFRLKAYLTMKAADPLITGFKAYDMVPALTYTSAAPSVQDGATEGGWQTGVTGTNYVWIGSSVFQNTAGGHWAFAALVKFATLAAGVNGQFGIANAATSHDVSVVAKFAQDATHFALNIDGAGSTQANIANADPNAHVIVVVCNGTNIRVYIDPDVSASPPAPVANLTQATLTNLTTEPMFPLLFAANTGDVKAQFFMVGYIKPL